MAHTGTDYIWERKELGLWALPMGQVGVRARYGVVTSGQVLMAAKGFGSVWFCEGVVCRAVVLSWAWG